MAKQMTEKRIHDAAQTFKLLSDPSRLRLVTLLMKKADGLCVNDLAEAANMSHSAASHQLAKLEAHNVVTGYRDGQTICYQLNDNAFTDKLRQAIDVAT